jgi:Subtilase family
MHASPNAPVSFLLRTLTQLTQAIRTVGDLPASRALRRLAGALMAVALACLTPRALAQSWAEQGDAGQLCSAAQVTVGTGTLSQITGTVSNMQDVDIYGIRINNPATFSATTVGTSAFPVRVFYLFSASCNGVVMSNFSTQGQSATITNQFVPLAGDYFLAIVAYDKAPLNSGAQQIWLSPSSSQQAQPNGPGAPGPLASWTTTSFSQPTGAYTISLTGASYGAAPLANDLCANATVLSGCGSVTAFSNVGAGTDGPAACGSIGRDIWYRLTAGASGLYTADTCTNTNYDSVVVVYTGSCGALTLVACNDDSTACGAGSNSSRVTWTATFGTQYYLRVGGFSSDQGAGSLTVTVPSSCSPPVITQQLPALTQAQVGQSVSFTAQVTGATSIEWHCAGTVNSIGSGATLTIPTVTGNHQKYYYYIASNCCGPTISRSTQLYVSPSGHLLPLRPACTPPAEYQTDDVTNGTSAGPPDGLIDTSTDVNPANRIDDSLDQSQPASAEVIVMLGRCAQDAFYNRLVAIGRQSDVLHRYDLSPGFHMRLSYAHMVQMATDPSLTQIALFIILPNPTFSRRTDVSVPSMGITAGFYSPNTIQEHDSWVDGSGVNVALLDSGVDNPGSMIDASTPSNPFLLNNSLPRAVAGYDVVRDMSLPPLVPPSNALRAEAMYDPDDNDAVGHGTHMASIILGRGVPGLVPRGVAPGANLIDIKVFDQNGLTDTATIMRAIEVLWGQRDSMGVVVDVAVFGFLGDIPASDVAPVSALLDIISVYPSSMLGTTVMVAPAGVDTDYDTESTLKRLPASHNKVIAVGATDTLRTQNRADDVLWPFTPAGPRSLVPLDVGQYTLDHLRPQLVAPGANIVAAQSNTQTGTRTLSGTCMSAAHVAGVAALFIQAGSTDPLGAMIATAEQPPGTPAFGGPFAGTPPPRPWNERWGYGTVNAFGGLDRFIDRSTDVAFVDANGNRTTSASAFFYPFGIGCDGDAVIRVRVKNFGTHYAANDVKVYLGTETAHLAGNRYIHVGGRWIRRGSANQFVATIPIGATQTFEATVQMPASYRPRRGWFDRAFGIHNSRYRYRRCNFDLTAVIASSNDSSTWDNSANITTTIHASPNLFELTNHFTTGPGTFTFQVTPGTPNSQWGFEIDPPSVTIGPSDPAVIVSLLPIPPMNAPDGATESFAVTTLLNGLIVAEFTTYAHKNDCNSNLCDDWFDVVGRPGCPLVSADGDEDGIPDECQCGSADFNCDGDLGTDADIESFFACLAGTCPALPCTGSPDFNHDGDIGTDADIESFFRVLSGGPC